MNKEKIIEEISSRIKVIVKEQLNSLCELNLDRITFCEIELEIRKQVQEIGRNLLEQSIPLLYGDGYIGPKYENDIGDKCQCIIRNHNRDFLSTFGKITYSRAYYNNISDGHSYGITDSKLNLEGKSRISPALKYFSGLLSINMPYKESSSILSKIININLSSSQNDKLLLEKGRMRNEVYNDKIFEISNDANGKVPPANIKYNTKNPKRIIYLETDGCHIPTLESWKECKTFVLFETEKIQNEKTNEIKFEIKNKKYYSTMNQIIAFKKQLKVAIEEYCGNDEVSIVCIGDGAAWIWKMCKELFCNNAIEILDWYHVDEKICELSSKIFEDEETLKEYFQYDIKNLLYSGRINDALDYLHQYYEKIPKVLIPDLMNTIGYIENNRSKMNYQYYKENLNLVIGSGTIESANKYVIQRRMKLSGMRWDLSNANCIAQLRSDYINGDFEKLYGVRNNFQFANNQENEIKLVN
jgi:hypothetical protein